MGRIGKDDTKHPPGAFDIYAFAQSWSPTFCCNTAAAAVCKRERISNVTDVVTHGLWPHFVTPDGQGKLWPEYCTKAPKQALEGLSGRQRHEYKKHGSCTRLSPQAYAQQERTLASSAALQPARTFLVANATGSVPTGALVNKLGGPRRAAVRVDSKCRLAEMTTCWRKGPEDAVAEQIDCPTALLTSSRNNAMQLGCVRVLLGEAGACSAVSDQLLKVLKGKRPAVPPHQHGPAPPPSSS
eukprot:m.44291 g.44291  ORF g.44291 m.44291 type:complete len:241 (-) comp6502_c0_seq2:58-780(-)